MYRQQCHVPAARVRPARDGLLAGLLLAVVGVIIIAATALSAPGDGASAGAQRTGPGARQALLMLTLVLLSAGGGALVYTMRRADRRQELSAHLHFRALQKSVEHLRGMLDAQTEMILRIRADGNVTFANEAFAERCGVPVNQLLGQNILKFLPPGCADNLNGRLAALTVQQAFRTSEFEVPVAGPERRWEAWTDRAEFDESGRLVAIQSVGRDVTRWKAAEQCQQRALQRVTMALEGSDAGLWDWNLLTGEVYFNDRYAQIVGYRRDELAASEATWERLTHPADKPRVLEVLQEHLAGKRPIYDIEYRWRSKCGKYVWIHDRGKLVERDARGHPIRMVGTHLDISERKEADEHACRLARAVDAAADALVLTDPEGCILRINPAFTRITGYSAEEAIGQTPRILRSGNESAALYQELWTTIRRGEIWSGRLKNRRKDGSFYFADLSVSPIVDDAGEILGYVGFQRDVSDEVEREHKLRDYAQTLRLANMELEAQKQQLKAQQVELAGMNAELATSRAVADEANSAKSQFLANMSHEIRTPITAIIGFADLLTEELEALGRHHAMVEEPAPAACREHVRIIRRNSEHLLALINDILDISKIEAGRMTAERIACSATQIVEEVAALMRSRAHASGLKIEVEHHFPLPEQIQTDPLRLRQILVNLVGNAVKFSTHGVVRVDSRFATRPHGTPQFSITVTDSGIGMSADQLGRLFQPFTQADASTTRRYGGTGLGLTISKRLAHLLGGDISVTSAPGEGSAFTLTIDPGPLRGTRMLQDPERADEPETPGVAAARGRSSLSGRVLLAEDGVANQRLIRAILERTGLTVDVAEDGQVACELVARAGQNAPYQLILMDMQMPRMDGYQATQHIRRSGFNGPIVALTAHAMTHDRTKCLSAGCDEYLSKPFERDHLLDVVAQFLNRQHANSAGS